MQKPSVMIYGAATGLTILIWVLAFTAAHCASQPPKDRAQSSDAATPAAPLPAEPRTVDPEPEGILDVALEARLTCSLNEEAELPPGEVDFMPIGDGSDARLRGPAGEQALLFASPVRFREHAGSLTVINRFVLPPGSNLHGRPPAALGGFTELVVPIVTVVYGTACRQMRLLELSVRLNGEDLWYSQWTYDDPFQQSPVFTVPLDALHARIR